MANCKRYRPIVNLRIRLATALLLTVTSIAVAQVSVTEATNFSVHAGRDARLVIDALGSIWIVPQNGGVAEPIASGPLPARRPRWSPAADRIVYQTKAASSEQLWLYEFATGAGHKISRGNFFDQQPSWHPDGNRIVFSSDRRDSGFDIWELDLPTGLTWRLTHSTGDETEPAWSADGKDLVYLHREADRWSLMLRRHGQADRILESSTVRLSAPAWRPDGSLITFIRHGAEALSLEMVILSEPPLVRAIVTNEDLFVAPATWRGRQQLLYTANGLIRKRDFNAWRSTTLPFRVTVMPDPDANPAKPEQRELDDINPPVGELVLRVAKLFDGVSSDYQEDRDIVIRAGRIAAVEAQRDRPGAIVVDMHDLTALPGFVDSSASLPAATTARLGPLLLSLGVTTIVSSHPDADTLNRTWSNKVMPGPRLLDASWVVDLDTAPSLMLGARSLPASPRGIRYQDLLIGSPVAPTAILSGLADARTNGLGNLLASRQAPLLERYPSALRRFTEKPPLANLSTMIVLGSSSNGLPPGLALHAELRAIAEAGLNGAQVLKTAGVNAATALGLGLQLGRIAPGSAADIVLVDGDPLRDIADAQKVVGVVRNGRFFSAIGLLERVQAEDSVE